MIWKLEKHIILTKFQVTNLTMYMFAFLFSEDGWYSQDFRKITYVLRVNCKQRFYQGAFFLRLMVFFFAFFEILMQYFFHSIV